MDRKILKIIKSDKDYSHCQVTRTTDSKALERFRSPAYGGIYKKPAETLNAKGIFNHSKYSR